MFLIRFFIGGLMIASIPLIAHKFGDKVAGYITLFPIIMILSFVVLFLTNGSKSTIHAAQAYLIGLPSVAIATIVILILLHRGINIYLTVVCGIASWILVILFTAKFIY
jgi:uncharacterized membrane protein (GlpM family)